MRACSQRIFDAVAAFASWRKVWEREERGMVLYSCVEDEENRVGDVRMGGLGAVSGWSRLAAVCTCCCMFTGVEREGCMHSLLEQLQ